MTAAAAATPARPWQVAAGGLSLTVRLTPRGGREALEGIETRADGRCVLKARVRAPAIEGAANAALVRPLATALGVAPGAVSVITGDTARIKRLHIGGDGARLAAALETIAGGRL